MKTPGINPEPKVITTEEDRLDHPWRAFIFGALISLGIVAVIMVRALGSGPTADRATIGLLAFAALAVVLSGCYAFVGATHSIRLAQRIVGAAGLLLAVGGLAWLLYALLVLAP